MGYPLFYAFPRVFFRSLFQIHRTAVIVDDQLAFLVEFHLGIRAAHVDRRLFGVVGEIVLLAGDAHQTGAVGGKAHYGFVTEVSQRLQVLFTGGHLSGLDLDDVVGAGIVDGFRRFLRARREGEDHGKRQEYAECFLHTVPPVFLWKRPRA